jgi:hypothetical protein
MSLVAFDYRFTVRLPANADVAYRWATDYAPDDPGRMGQVGRRRVERLASGTVLLTDTVRSEHGTVTKKRLVRLRPRERSWTNTHLAGPTRHSQFLYRIIPNGPRRSTLEFVGLQVERAARPLSASALARRARTVAAEDAATWRRQLVPSMIRDLGLRRSRRRPARSG